MPCFILDLHLHSKYSRGTSPQMDLENIYRWSKIKGIQVVGTGDFTHPQWFREIQKKLEPAEPGLFRLKKTLARKQDKTLPACLKNNQSRFILTAEISNIYKKHDQVRKMHNILVAPDLKTVSQINAELQKIGNLTADGRPILGLDSKKLLQITLKVNPDSFFIPAHIWTPWFSLFGSKSGFNTIEQAFEELSPHITAVETGLSSDPFMNWRLKALRKITLVSNSDAHSPLKLGREANLLNCPLNYHEIIKALKTNSVKMTGTIEFFPQEGKYHYDGHRSCGIRLTPEQTRRYKGLCPKCGRPVVVGVDYRVNELADFSQNSKPKKHKTVEYIIPLVEILAELKGAKTIGAGVLQKYHEIYSALGDEFSILRTISPKVIKQAGFPNLAIAINRLRRGRVYIEPGYDGVFGIIKVFSPKEQAQRISGQTSLF
ncbi:MAG: endonuclease Q family protein [Patescibacteria group bacterium]|nr:endonuclease Q family protein [Patescibacteria group bacterium]